MAERAPRGGAALAALVAATLLGAGCRTMAPASGGAEPLGGLVAADFGTQHLFHLHGRRDGADLRLRLALRIWDAASFDLTASDPFGRALWRVEVSGESGVWIDLRERRRCRVDSSAPIDLPGFGVPYAAVDLAPLLLGRQPAARPGAGVSAQRAGGSLRLVLADPALELEWRETATAALPAASVPPARPDPGLLPCTDADFS